MILRSRFWRLLICTGTLLIAGVLMLLLAAPASYALQDDTPKLIARAGQLLDKETPLDGTYVYTTAAPDFTSLVTTEDLVVNTYHWLLLPGYDNLLLVRAEGPDFLREYARSLDLMRDPAQHPTKFYGKITALEQQAGYDEVLDELASLGVEVDKSAAMVILQGEEPRGYRPVVPVIGFLAMSWTLALVGLLRILTGRNARRKT